MVACEKCGECCKGYPCGLKPEDVHKIAEFLKMDVKDFLIKYCTIDYYCENTGDLYYICPKRSEDKGNFTGLYWAFSSDPCIFWDKQTKLCNIHDVKPYGGSIANCKDKDSILDKRELAGFFTSPEGKKYIEILMN